MPFERLTKLEIATNHLADTTIKLARQVEALSDNIVLLQQVMEYRATKGKELAEWGKAEIAALHKDNEALHAELDNVEVTDIRAIKNSIGLIHQRWHQLSNMIMGLTIKVDEVAEYMGILENNQEQMKAQLKSPYDNAS
jgi:hypothetical protein